MATLKDVAKASDVSPATVSNVLTGKAVVHPRTRKRIMQAMSQLNYRPNAVARGLTQKRMNTLGVVLYHPEASMHTNPFFMWLLDGILSVATRAGQNTTLYTLENWYDEAGVLSRICDRRCDGLLLLSPPADTGLVPALLATDLPCVLVSSHYANAPVSSVDVNNQAGAAAVVRHLLDQGHRRIAFAASSGDLRHHFGRERLEGYRQALEAGGVTFCEEQILDIGRAADLARRWKQSPSERPTAVFCSHDLEALTLMQHLIDQGLHVPEDIAVAGFDDLPAAPLNVPPLTTVRQPITRLGERAAEMLLAQINGEAEAGIKEFLPTELVVRQSTGFSRPS